MHGPSFAGEREKERNRVGGLVTPYLIINKPLTNVGHGIALLSPATHRGGRRRHCHILRLRTDDDASSTTPTPTATATTAPTTSTTATTTTATNAPTSTTTPSEATPRRCASRRACPPLSPTAAACAAAAAAAAFRGPDDRRRPPPTATNSEIRPIVHRTPASRTRPYAGLGGAGDRSAANCHGIGTPPPAAREGRGERHTPEAMLGAQGVVPGAHGDDWD